MIGGWTKIEVYCDASFIGSFYTNQTNQKNIEDEINEEYGENNWTKYNVG